MPLTRVARVVLFLPIRVCGGATRPTERDLAARPRGLLAASAPWAGAGTPVVRIVRVPNVPIEFSDGFFLKKKEFSDGAREHFSNIENLSEENKYHADIYVLQILRKG